MHRYVHIYIYIYIYVYTHAIHTYTTYTTHVIVYELEQGSRELVKLIACVSFIQSLSREVRGHLCIIILIRIVIIMITLLIMLYTARF